jgi:F-type H+-transporting ATPase subunit epsilon
MSESAEILLEVVSPVETLVHRMVDSVQLPGTNGLFEVLPGHAPLISSLTEGQITYTSDNGKSSIKVHSGFVEVNDNKVSVCVEI